MRQTRGHGLKHVTDALSLEEFVKNLKKAEEQAFETQETHIQSFMFARFYDPDDIDDYLNNGLPPRINKVRYSNYYILTVKARELHFKYTKTGGSWLHDPGNALITHHFDTLLTIRMNWSAKKDLILRTYKDAAKTAYFYEKLTENMWDYLANMDKKLTDTVIKSEGEGCTIKEKTLNLVIVNYKNYINSWDFL